MPCSIQHASQLSGLSSHVIRIWERRYNALSPSRTDTNRRMYCDEAIKRLKLLRVLTENGHRIGGVAKLGTEQLEELVKKIPAETMAVPAGDLEMPEQFVNAAIAASKKYDSDLLRRLLLQARRQLGQRGMLHQVICPLIVQIGESWQHGNLRPSHEHIATAVIRELLLTPVPGSQVATHAPELVVATPAGELHELGAMIVAATARDLGWRVTYMGPNLPVEEIAACALARQATAVALSVVYPEGCPVIQEKLRRMRELLPPAMALIVGGRAAAGYKEKLTDADIRWVGCLHGLDNELLQIRK
jgi:DNA-binding transcriptional MerR regulator/methylmalonyl-CoA mutase cobalamin-binding subunit|uniref:MerR family transcriptional regulator n=1 Tax=Prosthecobacter sp. TaxID=1965333 RepID=UPI003784CFBC